MDPAYSTSATPVIAKQFILDDTVQQKENASHKREHSGDDGPPSKKFKTTVEMPQTYSDAVRRKMASTSRTGQACDRCKERKMKCDTDPQACQPCRQKNLRCFTTDRVTGQSRERGQDNRTESELQFLRDQYAAYQRRYGPIQGSEYTESSFVSPAESARGQGQYLPQPTPDRDKHDPPRNSNMPNPKYVGWPALDHVESLHHGPMDGTVVDTCDGLIDIADFECDMMKDPTSMNTFNLSRVSIMNTITGHQTITDPRLPSKDEALRDANIFLVVVSHWVPVVHRPSFIDMVNRIYDQPNTVSLAEQVQLVVVLGIMSFQSAVRNHQQAAEKFEQSHYWIHYGLTWYRDLFRERSLASMQALTLLLIHFRNLPKPGITWSLGNTLLISVMELEFHRNPEKIKLSSADNNPLTKELRKRVFHTILSISVTTGCRVSRPAPWQFHHWDVSLPSSILDSEYSKNGIISELSGRCDIWPCIHLAKFLPLLTEMYNYVTSVRRPVAEYLEIIEILHAKVDAWRQDWEATIKQDEYQVNIRVATLLMENWAAEYVLNLYHPSLYPDLQSDIMDRHVEICHKQAQRLLKNFHILSSKYKGVDLTWHSTAAYALGFGMTLHVYRRKKGKLTNDQFEVMKNELKGWMSLVAYADVVMRTGNHLQHLFEPRVRKLEDECRHILKSTTAGQSTHDQSQTQQTMSASKPSSSTKIETNSYPNLPVNGSNGLDIGPTTPQQLFPVQSPSGQSWPASMVYPQNSAPANMAAFAALSNQYQPVPTSLAPLLNGSPNRYMGYSGSSTPSSNDMMMFTPTRFGADGNIPWPLTTLPNDQISNGST